MTKHIVPSSPKFRRQPTTGGSLDPELMQIFGPPPLLPRESLDEYNGLHDRVRRDVMPSGAIEEIWVRDFVDPHLGNLSAETAEGTALDQQGSQRTIGSPREIGASRRTE